MYSLYEWYQLGKNTSQAESSGKYLTSIESTHKSNAATGNKARNDLKKIIKEPNSTLTTGRSKKVQFNTLPDFAGPKNRKSMFFFDEFDEEVRKRNTISSHNPKKKQSTEDTPKMSEIISRNGLEGGKSKVKL